MVVKNNLKELKKKRSSISFVPLYLGNGKNYSKSIPLYSHHFKALGHSCSR